MLKMLLAWRKFHVLRQVLFHMTLGTLKYPYSYSKVTFFHPYFLKTNTQIFKAYYFNIGWGEQWKSSKSLRLTGIKMPFELAIRLIIVFAFSFYSQQSKVQDTLKLLLFWK